MNHAPRAARWSVSRGRSSHGRIQAPGARSKEGGEFGANYYDVETGDEHWLSGVKKNRQDRHWAGSGPVGIDDDARDEYEREIGRKL